MAKKTASKSASRTAPKAGTKRPKAKPAAKAKPDTRTTMHRLVRDTLANHALDLESVRKATTVTLEGLGEGLRHAMPADRANILHQTFDGLVEAFTAASESARHAYLHALAAGRRVSREEVAEFTGSMRAVERHFLDAVSDAAKGMSKEAKATLDELVRRATKAGTSIGKVGLHASGTAARRAPEFAVEAAKASGRAAAAMASELAMGMSGFLSGLGDALRTSGRAKAAPKPAAKRGPKPASKRKR